MKINNKTESNPKIMAATFNSFFVTIVSDTDSKIIHTNINYKDYLQGFVLNPFFLKATAEKEVISVINEMKTNKSTDPNSITTHLQTPNLPINHSDSNGIFSDLLKTSNVIPVFKAEETQDYNNYPPISLISNLSKLKEKIVHPLLQAKCYNCTPKFVFLREKLSPF